MAANTSVPIIQVTPPHRPNSGRAGDPAARFIHAFALIFKTAFSQCYNPAMSKARAKKIKLLLLDVDGVMTDGKLFLIPSGESTLEAKGFHAHDGTGFSLARLGGIKTGLITKRISATVRLRAHDLKIEHVYQGAADKLATFREILAKEKLQPEEAAFVGDDIIDLPVMRACGLAFAVADAREDVKDEAHVITDHRGGEGAVRDAVEYILKAQGTLARCIEGYLSDRTPVETKMV